MNRLLVAGATGLVGRAAVEHFSTRPGWEVVALSRRPHPWPNTSHVSADLTARQSCLHALASAGPVTHVLYAALHERPNVVAGWRDPVQMDVNRRMLSNLVDAVEATSPPH